MLQKLNDESSKNDLTMNLLKTKVFTNIDDDKGIKIADIVIAWVDSCAYLAYKLKFGLDKQTTEIQRTIDFAWPWSAFRVIFKSKMNNSRKREGCRTFFSVL